MAGKFRLTMAQLNPTVGDLAGNRAKAMRAHVQGRANGADFVALPEMFLVGYQPQDLILKPAFLRHAWDELHQLAADCADGPPLGIGLPIMEYGQLFNVYAILSDGEVIGYARKHHLPNYNVFDEERLFAHGPISGPFPIGPLRMGTPICEDSWYDDVTEAMAESGAELLMIPNGSPYRRGKFDVRVNHMVSRVIETGLPLVYLNMVGAQDDQIFDGGSFILNPHGKLVRQFPVFDEVIAEVDFEEKSDGWRAIPGDVAVHEPVVEQDYRAMVMALHDYMAKSGFKKVVLGLSGGVDSALVATIAADALGPDNVHCVMLPSEFTSDESLEDAAGVANSLGCRLDTVPITRGREAITETLAPLFEGMPEDLTEENIQSRLRGLLLMALSNKFGSMLLTTGNKSEVAVGYATIYGDMAGGYNPIKDLYKMRVFETCRWRNANHRPWMRGPVGMVIPQRVIDKPPSAELRADQKDEDSLPPYEVLDAILEHLMEDDMAVSEIVEKGFERETVKKIENLLYSSEYKRFQSAPGARLTRKAFWLDRRYPIVNRWRDPS
ncbi:NAD+ synthase [Amaricoccus tamworthensis]|uniref:NAD+ synthase n=1 Tax=Amaricoccus tamworthensis TaxID=57002 RepID=UPI003C7C9EF7